MSLTKKSVYLDHAATTPMHPEVIDRCMTIMQEGWGNPNSLHSYGRKAYGLLEKARITMANELHASPDEIVFTGSGTESDNTAITQFAYARRHLGNHLITTNIEHSAVLEPMQDLEKNGFEVSYLQVDESGLVSLEQVQEAIRPDTILVSIMYTNNEVGTILPIEVIGNYLQTNHSEVLFHTDAVQAFGLQEIDVDKAAIDLLSASAHKVNGPKGVGLLYIRHGISFPSLIKGGSQELSRRAGTVNVPGIIGFQKSIEIIQKERSARKERYQQLTNAVLEGLEHNEVDFKVNGSEEFSSPHILSLWIKEVPSEKLLTQLDLVGFAVAAGSACSAGDTKPSHVLSALYGKGHAAVYETIRLSFGLGNSIDEIGPFILALSKASSRYQKKQIKRE